MGQRINQPLNPLIVQIFIWNLEHIEDGAVMIKDIMLSVDQIDIHREQSAIVGQIYAMQAIPHIHMQRYIIGSGCRQEQAVWAALLGWQQNRDSAITYIPVRILIAIGDKGRKIDGRIQ